MSARCMAPTMTSGRRHHIPLIAAGDRKGVRLELVATDILEVHDAPLGMSGGVGKIARGEDIEVTISVEIRDYRLGRSIHGEKVALGKIVVAIILQDPDAVVRLENTRIVEVVAVHVQDVRFAVAVEVTHGEVHRAIYRRKAGQHLTPSGKIPRTVIGVQNDSLISLREQRHDIRESIPREVDDFEPYGAWRGIENVTLIRRAIRPIERQTPAVVAEFADHKVLPAIPGKVELPHEDRPQERVAQDFAEVRRPVTGKIILHERTQWPVIG